MSHTSNVYKNWTSIFCPKMYISKNTEGQIVHTNRHTRLLKSANRHTSHFTQVDVGRTNSGYLRWRAIDLCLVLVNVIHILLPQWAELLNIALSRKGIESIYTSGGPLLPDGHLYCFHACAHALSKCYMLYSGMYVLVTEMY